MEFIKLLLLIICSVILLFLVLPAIVVFFIFRVKDIHKSAQRAKIGVIIGIIAAVLLLGVIVWDAIDLLLPDKAMETPTEPTVITTETPAPTEELPTVTEELPTITEDIPMIGATISTEQLDGQWIAISEPEIPEDENYTYAANGGYYTFDLNGTFSYTQVKLVKAGTWKALNGNETYTGTYILEGDVLTLHYKSYSMQSEEEGLEYDLDETDVISMRINQSCTEMCVLAPDHPKLGKLFLFQKGRGSDPVNALLIALNAAY